MEDDNSLPTKSVAEPGKCPIAEIIQYSCEVNLTRAEHPVVHCFPFSRLFQMCPGVSAVELTKVLKVDENGSVEIPANISPPSGKLWRQVSRNEEPKT